MNRNGGLCGLLSFALSTPKNCIDYNLCRQGSDQKSITLLSPAPKGTDDEKERKLPGSLMKK